MSSRMLITSVAVSLLAVSSGAHATILLQDDFNDNSIDPAKWNTVTSGVPHGGQAVAEQNQRMEITNRGYLNTVSEYDPADPGTLRVSGTWTIPGATGNPSGEFIQIVTRSDGTPAGSFGEARNGIAFQLNTIGQGIGGLVLENGTRTGIPNGPGTTNNDISASPGDVFDFVLTDDGLNLTFQVAEVGGNLSSAYWEGASPFASPMNLVTFYNRENNFVSHTSYLDNVVIERIAAVPEPSAYAMAAIGLLGLGFYGWRRKRATKPFSRFFSPAEAP